MPTPSTRTPLRVARGTYSNLNSSVSDIQVGEICYATDQDKLYVKEGSSLVSTQADISTKANSASPSFTGTVDFGGTGAEFNSNGQLTLKYNGTQTDPYLRILNRDDSLNNAILMYGNGSATFVSSVTAGSFVCNKGSRAVIQTLTDGATITPDFAQGTNFTVTLAGNRTIANPSNLSTAVGQSGSIFLVQDGTGSRTASWGSYWDFAGGTAPTLTTTASAVDRIDYVVRSSTSIHAVATLAYS